MRQREISDKPEGTQPAPDKIEQAPSGALLPVHASDKGDEAPVSLNETRSPSNDKDEPSQRGHTNSLNEITVHSRTESTLISPKAYKLDCTQFSLDKRAEDKNEDENGVEIPPPTLQENP
jgi:hypothetical protein